MKAEWWTELRLCYQHYNLSLSLSLYSDLKRQGLKTSQANPLLQGAGMLTLIIIGFSAWDPPDMPGEPEAETTNSQLIKCFSSNRKNIEKTVHAMKQNNKLRF